jgi:DNA-binding NarL/FixJ family response regulator
LTNREWEVAELIVRGEQTKSVAAALHVSPRTVETHLASVYRKLGIGSRTDLKGLLHH